MNNFSNEELTVLLGYYYFDEKKNDNKLLQSFVRTFNDTFKKDLSQQIIMYQLSLFKSVDSSYNAKQTPFIEQSLVELWNYYVLQDRLKTLKEIYKVFKSGGLYIREPLIEMSDNDALFKINDNINKSILIFSEDKPKKLYEYKSSRIDSALRDIQVSLNALKLADYKCECSSTHELFLRKNSNYTYTEGHHLIPLEFQYLFDYNLDVEANVVSLCSNCHNHLHYGRNPEKILNKLLTEERKKRLSKCGIKITIEELISFYK